MHRHRDTRTRRLARRLDAGDAPRVVERAESGLGIEVGALGGEAIVALREQEIPGRERLVLVAEHHHVVGVDLAVGAFDLDVADVVRVFHLVRVLAAIGPDGFGSWSRGSRRCRRGHRGRGWRGRWYRGRCRRSLTWRRRLLRVSRRGDERQCRREQDRGKGSPHEKESVED